MVTVFNNHISITRPSASSQDEKDPKHDCDTPARVL